MERLTIRNRDGSVSQPMDLRWADALEKLADYEDTGLKPGEIKSLLAEWNACRTVLKSFLEEEHEGRLFRLPVRIGDAVWDTESLTEAPSVHIVLGADLLRNVVMIHLSSGQSLPASEFGKSVFLTKEEAEKALEKERGAEE